MLMTPKQRVTVTLMLVATFVLGALAQPAAADGVAPQPVDTTEQGALGFALMALMCGMIVAALFFMDNVRKRRSGEEQ
jgi:hypothetical protein